MKLPFFNVKIAHRSNGDAFNAIRISIVEKLEKQLPLPEGLLSIHFTFSASDLTNAEAFANCLKGIFTTDSRIIRICKMFYLE